MSLPIFDLKRVIGDGELMEIGEVDALSFEPAFMSFSQSFNNLSSAEQTLLLHHISASSSPFLRLVKKIFLGTAQVNAVDTKNSDLLEYATEVLVESVRNWQEWTVDQKVLIVKILESVGLDLSSAKDVNELLTYMPLLWGVASEKIGAPRTEIISRICLGISEINTLELRDSPAEKISPESLLAACKLVPWTSAEKVHLATKLCEVQSAVLRDRSFWQGIRFDELEKISQTKAGRVTLLNKEVAEAAAPAAKTIIERLDKHSALQALACSNVFISILGPEYAIRIAQKAFDESPASDQLLGVLGNSDELRACRAEIEGLVQNIENLRKDLQGQQSLVARLIEKNRLLEQRLHGAVAAVQGKSESNRHEVELSLIKTLVNRAVVLERNNPDTLADLNVVDSLLRELAVERIAKKGDHVIFDPREHQDLEEIVYTSQKVRVISSGYRWNSSLGLIILIKAVVTP